MKTDKITERDKQDFWIQKHQDEVDKLMKKETSMLNEGSITQDQYDKQLYKRLETNKLIVYQKDLRVLAIYREMSLWFYHEPANN